jgi:hypothetical protein
VLSSYPGCRSAAAILSPSLVLFRTRGQADTYAVAVEPQTEGGRVASIDPAAAASAVHAWFLRRSPAAPIAPGRLSCVVGHRAFTLLLRPATAAEATQPF